MKPITKKSMLALILFIIPIVSNAQAPWQHKYTKDGITVSQRPVPNSEYDEFIATGLIDAPIEECIRIMNSVSEYKKWMKACLQSREVLPREGKTFYYYIESHSPWPAANRDGIYKGTVIEKGDSVTFVMTAIDRNDIVPERKGIVRQTQSSAHWIFVKKGKATELSYYIKTNPGGSLQPSLFNFSGKDIPYDNIIALRKWVAACKK